MPQFLCSLFVFLFYFTLNYASNLWPNHEISKLKLLQIVHRHGERTPVIFASNDPFKNEYYWPEGIGELTTKGKYRMYKVGQFIRQEYDSYLGGKYSPREVFVRSSITDRCIESTSCLLSGAYPPKQKSWQWNNGNDGQLGQVWQPFPIQTFMPKSDDLVCNQEKFCPAVNNEMEKILNRSVIKKYLNENNQLFTNLSKITGKRIDSLGSAVMLWDALSIEVAHNYYWNKVWTREEELNIIKQLSTAHEMQFRYDWDSPINKRLRAGGLVKELNKNFQSVLKNENNRKLYVYSTHDSTLSALMHALNIYNGISPPFGATLLLELHEKRNSISQNNIKDYFVRAFYYNETTIKSGIPHQIKWTDCQNLVDCPFNQYFNSTKHLLYENFNEECHRKY